MEGQRSGKKRLNKNRPEEKSSKAPPRQYHKQHRPIDPRFDSAFGDYSERAFTSTYGFLSKVKKREKSQLIKQLKKEKDPAEIEKIRYLLARTKNQEREKRKKDMKQQKLNEENKKYAEAVFAGQTPTFPSKKEQLAEEVLQNYEQLNTTGKLNKYIMKKHKKMSSSHKKHNNQF